MEICNYMRCIYPLFYEKIEQYIGSVFLINKLTEQLRYVEKQVKLTD